MAETIKENAGIILTALYEESQTSDTPEIEGDKIRELTQLEPQQINDAVEILNDNGYVEWQQFLGTAPFNFGYVEITPRGKAEYERALEESKRGQNIPKTPDISSPITPVGSPYGFLDNDWELVIEKKAEAGKLNVVVGYQFKSEHYNSEILIKNLHEHFEKAVAAYNAIPTSLPVKLDFSPLAAGYGEHLFNEICRDIICADIAVFETSDLNPNVMLEMGVALTWGIRVLPIKVHGSQKPPSDISGHTWADYLDSGGRFVDTDHERKMFRMVERAARKKGIRNAQQ